MLYQMLASFHARSCLSHPLPHPTTFSYSMIKGGHSLGFSWFLVGKCHDCYNVCLSCMCVSISIALGEEKEEEEKEEEVEEEKRRRRNRRGGEGEKIRGETGRKRSKSIEK